MGRNNFSFSKFISAVINRKQFSMIIPWDAFKWADNYSTYAGEGYQKNSLGYFAIQKIAQKCGEIPLKLWRIENGEKKRVESHPILDLLQRPNDNQHTYSQFVQAWVSYLMLDGNSYMFTLAEGNRLKFPDHVMLIQPDLVSAKFDAWNTPLEYTIRVGESNDLTLPFQTGGFFPLSHTKLFNPSSQRSGLSPFSPLRFSVQLLNETNLFAVNFIKNRCSPPGLLTTEQTLVQDQRGQLEKILEEKYSGPQNAGRPMVLWGGLKWQSMTGSGREQISILEGRDYNDRDIARTLGVPPVLLGIPGDSTFNNLLEAKREFVLSTCRPRMTLLAQSLNNWLLENTKDKALFLEPDIDDLPEIREWRMASWEKVDKLTSATINEKRQLMGFETKEGAVYDDVFVSSSTVLASDFDSLLDDIDNGESELLDNEDDEKSISFLQCKTVGISTARQKALYRKQYLRIFKQIERRLKNNLKRFFVGQGRTLSRKRAEFNSIEEAEAIYDSVLAADSEKLKGILARHYKTSFTVFHKFIEGGFKSARKPLKTKQLSDLDFAINEFIRNNTAKHVQIMNETSKKRVMKELREIFEIANIEESAPSLQELSEVITGVHKDFGLKRAAVIARTETTSAVTKGSIESVKTMRLQKPTKTWLSDLRGDGISRPNHFNTMNEVTVGLEEKFEVPNLQGGVDLMEGPGDQNAPVGQIANCVCILAFDADDVEIEG